MNLVSAQQVALDNALVAPEKRLKIEKSNEELSSASHKERKHIKLHNQDLVKPPFEEEMVSFIQELGYSGKCEMLSAIHTDLMHQPWRTFAAIINRCISGKSS
ncbi:hypothetical protein Tco_1273037 [Tanacetum coccineum]